MDYRLIIYSPLILNNFLINPPEGSYMINSYMINVFIRYSIKYYILIVLYHTAEIINGTLYPDIRKIYKAHCESGQWLAK